MISRPISFDLQTYELAFEVKNQLEKVFNALHDVLWFAAVHGQNKLKRGEVVNKVVKPWVFHKDIWFDQYQK